MLPLSVMRSQFPDIGDGFVAVPTTYDFNNYTSIAYNPETKQYKGSLYARYTCVATDSLCSL